MAGPDSLFVAFHRSATAAALEQRRGKILCVEVVIAQLCLKTLRKVLSRLVVVTWLMVSFHTLGRCRRVSLTDKLLLEAESFIAAQHVGQQLPDQANETTDQTKD